MIKKCIESDFKIPFILFTGADIHTFGPLLFYGWKVIRTTRRCVVIENNDFKYEIASDGRNLSFHR